MKLPIRNTIKKSKNFKLNYNQTYEQYPSLKPSGLWYQIKDYALKWGEMNWGTHFYKLDVNIKSIYIIKTYDDFITFTKKYGKIIKDKQFKMIVIDWRLVEKKYSGIEIRNYNSIMKIIDSEQIKKNNMGELLYWFDTFDFNSGCIWNLSIIKDCSYLGKFDWTKKEKIRKY